MNTGGPNLFPEIGDCIQTNQLGTLSDIKQKCVNDFQKHIRVMKIEINLICAERRPHLLGTRAGIEFGQERQGAWSYNLRQIRLPIDHNEVILIARIILQESLKPFMLNRDMVNDGIEHQAKTATQMRNLIPVPERWIYLPI